MILRYLILFGGIVLMITGCNSLISQNFGTHRLRTLDVEDAAAGALGDADYVQLKDAIIGEAFIVGPALRSSDKDYVLRPILNKQQAAAWEGGETVEVNLVSWTETTDPACTSGNGCPPSVADPVIGLLSEPTSRKNPVNAWPAQRIRLAASTSYLQLNEKPMAWYWNLLLFLGGLGLAVVPEARRFANRASTKASATE